MSDSIDIPQGHIEVGDRIIFRSPTRWSNERATRIVRGCIISDNYAFPSSPRILVRYASCDDFIVHSHEVLEIL